MHPSPVAERQAAGRYGVMLAAVAVALVVRGLVSGLLGHVAPYTTLYPAVAVSAWYGGLGPGLTATALGALFGLYFFVAPSFSFEIQNVADGVGLLSFLAGGSLIAWLGESSRRAEHERQKAEAQQAHHHRWCMDTMDSIGDGVICTDVDALITYMNPVAEKLTGWDMRQVLGKPLTEIFNIINEETRGPAVNPIRRVLQEGVVLGLANHTLLIRRDGTEIPIDDSGAPIRSASKVINGAVLVFRDISERKKMDDDLRALTASLRRSNEDLQSYAHAISHDLQEPLRAIGCFSELFITRYRGRIDEDADTHLDFIKGGVGRMTAMIRGLLNFSRVAHADIQLRETPLAPVINWAEANLETAIGETNAIIRCESLPAVYGDQIQLVQLFQNLISNSIKYRRPGVPPEIHVRAWAGRGVWTIEVRDNGTGVAAADREQVFELFRRAHAPDVSGTGIGLALCKRIVERHHGKIWIEPDDSNAPGTAIRLTLLAPPKPPAASD